MFFLAKSFVVVVLILCVNRPVYAQERGYDCRPLEYLQPSVENLRLENADSKLSVARDLVAGWRSTLPVLMANVRKLPAGPVSAWQQSDRDFAARLLEVIQTILASTNQGIQLFRQCRDDVIIKRTVWPARDEDDSTTLLRIRAANILANVVDNTDVCFVLHHLRDKSIGVKGRANLLAVTLAMSGYAYKENAKAIQDTLNIVNDNLPRGTNSLTRLEQ
jgi:hypothetical protein